MVDPREGHVQQLQAVRRQDRLRRIGVVGDHHHLAAGAASFELLHVGRFDGIIDKFMPSFYDGGGQFPDQLLADPEGLQQTDFHGQWSSFISIRFFLWVRAAARYRAFFS